MSEQPAKSPTPAPKPETKPAAQSGAKPAQPAAKPAAAKPAPAKPAAKPAPAKPAVKPAPAKALAPVLPVASSFKRRMRHIMVLLSFILLVVVPTTIAGIYLYTRAHDQYASHVGFVVRQADVPSGAEMLSNFSGLAGVSNGSDADILYEYIRSHELVSAIDAKLDLRKIYNLPENDPVFTLGDDTTIEDLVWYWQFAVNVSLDSATGIMELRVLAFTPEDAQNIATEIFNESTRMINGLSEASRQDATRYAVQDLEKAFERLKETRKNVTSFRSENQLVDPSADIQGQMGLLNSLQAQLAESTIELDLVGTTTTRNDVRLTQLENRIAIIKERINEERQKIGLGASTQDGESFSNIVGQYEGLIVEREFAEQTYLQSLASLDLAKAEANRQSRYLAAYIKPTIAERAEYPKRLIYTLLIGLFCMLIWAIMSLVAYSLKDRR